MGCMNSSNVEQQGPITKPVIFFVLGGPGSGKGTQCQFLVRDYKFKHLSAGDLLRQEQARGTADATQIITSIKQGKLVRSDLIVKLLKKAIAQAGNRRFLIDGFPRNKENLQSFEKIIGNQVIIRSLLYFDCSEQCMTKRIMERGKTSGRADDNPQTIKKRLSTFVNETVPVVHQFELKGKCIKVNAEMTKQEVYKTLREQLDKHDVFPPTPPLIYFVAGGPGSGKGTQCQHLVRDYGFKHLSTGDLLREAQKKGSKQGAAIQQCIKEGKLVSSDIIISLIRMKLQKNNYYGRYLIDGFPRNEQNMQAWEKLISSQVSLKDLIYFQCSEEVMQARLLQRGKTSGRSDDNLQTIKKRFETFHKQTQPILVGFRQKNLILEVNAEKNPQQVYQQLQQKLASHGVKPKPKSTNHPKVIFVLGGPGSGKGTQCQNMVREFGFGHLSTGDLLREQQTHNGLNSELIADHIAEGKLVPSQILVRLVKKTIKKLGWGGTYLLDGFPRSITNIEAWDEEIGSEIEIKNMIFFECSQKVMEQRLIQRGKTSNRADDNPQTIKKRFTTFVQETAPIKVKYEKQGIVINVNAEKSKDEVYSDLKNQLLKNNYKLK